MSLKTSIGHPTQVAVASMKLQVESKKDKSTRKQHRVVIPVAAAHKEPEIAGISDDASHVPCTVLMHLDVRLCFAISCMHEVLAAGQ